ncbi:hypothetical protein ABIE87_004515 [Bradyrhizobium diazoefficiens]
MIAVADLFGHVDIFDVGPRPERRIGSQHQILEAARLAGADVEQPGHRGRCQQPHDDAHDVVDIDEIAALVAVGNAFAMRLEQLHDAARLDVVEAPRQHAHHRALVVLVGAEHVEEFQAHTLRRQLLAARDPFGHGEIEHMLAPAVEVHRPQFFQRRDRGVVVKACLAVAIGRRRGGVDQRHRIRRAPVEQAHGEAKIGLEHEIAVGRGGRGNRPEMDHGVEPAAVQPVGQLGRGDDIHKLALGEIAPLAVGAEEITHGDVTAAGVVQRSHDIRPDKTGSAGHQQHSNYPARCLRPDPCRSASFAKV